VNDAAEVSSLVRELNTLLNEDVPQPGSVNGVRIIKLNIPAADLRQDFPLGELFASLGFARSTGGSWRYDRARAADWFLDQLRALEYEWVQDPWRVPTPASQPPAADHDAGPRPDRRERIEPVGDPRGRTQTK
jgi:hypothetical protein